MSYDEDEETFQIKITKDKASPAFILRKKHIDNSKMAKISV